MIAFSVGHKWVWAEARTLVWHVLVAAIGGVIVLLKVT